MPEFEGERPAKNHTGTIVMVLVLLVVVYLYLKSRGGGNTLAANPSTDNTAGETPAQTAARASGFNALTSGIFGLLGEQSQNMAAAAASQTNLEGALGVASIQAMLGEYIAMMQAAIQGSNNQTVLGAAQINAAQKNSASMNSLWAGLLGSLGPAIIKAIGGGSGGGTTAPSGGGAVPVGGSTNPYGGFFGGGSLADVGGGGGFFG
jgi:hypothetical protein